MPPQHDENRLDALPERPRLKPHLTLLAVAHEYAILKGPTTFQKLTGPEVPTILEIEPLLDGDRTVAAIVEEADRDREEVLDALDGLAAIEALDEAADLPTGTGNGGSGIPQPVVDYMSHFSRRPAAPLEQAAEGSVTVVGLGPVGRRAATGLLASGVGSLTLLDPRQADAWVSRGDPGPAQETPSRADLAARRLRDRHGGEVAVVDAETDDLRALDPQVLRRALEDSDHAILCLEAPNSRLAARTNEVAVDVDTSWTLAVYRGPVAHVGPTVRPGTTPCWRCYDLRRKGATPALDHHLAYERDREGKPDRGRPAGGYLPLHADVVGGMVGQEALAVLSGAHAPGTEGHVIVQDLPTGNSRRHRVLKLPRCPACGPSDLPDVDRFNLDPVDFDGGR